MSTQIDSLTIEVEVNASRANAELEKLGATLGKLAQTGKLKNVSNDLKKITASVNGVESASKGFKASSVSLMALLSNLKTFASTIMWVGQVLADVFDDSIEWDSVKARFGRAFGEDAEEAYNWILKVNEALDINIQQFAQYSSLYGSLLKGFGLDQNKVTTMSTGLTELSYDIWAAYNDQYSSLAEASNAVRSAITGEIEPIRNAGISLTQASMQEYLDSVGMAHVNVANLSEAQKAEVRYAVMMNSALSQGIVGTYARETTTAEGAVRTLTQQLKSLGQAFGSVLIPIISGVLPYISAFITLLYEAISAVASFFGISMFSIDWGNTTDGLGDVASEASEAETALGGAGGAAKKLKDYLMGFDELNVISPNKGGGGGGGSNVGVEGWPGLDLESLWDEWLLSQANSRADEIIQGTKENFSKVINAIKGVWKDFVSWLDGLDDDIVSFFENLPQMIDDLPGKIEEFFTNLWDTISNFDWEELGRKIGTWFGNVLQDMEDKRVEMLENFKAFFTETLPGLFDSIPEAFAGLAEKIKECISWEDIKAIGTAIIDGIGEGLKTIEEAVVEFGDGFVDGLQAAIDDRALARQIRRAWKNAKEWWDNAKEALAEYTPSIGSIKEKLSEAWNAAVRWWQSKPWLPDYTPKIGSIRDKLEEAWHSASRWWESVKDSLSLNPKVNSFLSAIKSRFNEVRDWFNDQVLKLKIQLPHIEIDWNYDISAAEAWAADKLFGKKAIPELSVEWYAQGGFPDTGELFVAREAGAELVGNIGGRTAVANNDQIVAAVSQGVFSAVVSAMSRSAGSGNDGAQQINVYLDGKQIASSVEKRQRERGMQLMGTQVYSY